MSFCDPISTNDEKNRILEQFIASRMLLKEKIDSKNESDRERKERLQENSKILTKDLGKSVIKAIEKQSQLDMTPNEIEDLKKRREMNALAKKKEKAQTPVEVAGVLVSGNRPTDINPHYSQIMLKMKEMEKYIDSQLERERIYAENYKEIEKNYQSTPQARSRYTEMVKNNMKNLEQLQLMKTWLEEQRKEGHISDSNSEKIDVLKRVVNNLGSLSLGSVYMRQKNKYSAEYDKYLAEERELNKVWKKQQEEAMKQLALQSQAAAQQEKADEEMPLVDALKRRIDSTPTVTQQIKSGQTEITAAAAAQTPVASKKKNKKQDIKATPLPPQQISLVTTSPVSALDLPRTGDDSGGEAAAPATPEFGKPGGKGLHSKKNPYKVGKGGEFGTLKINIPQLKTGKLQVMNGSGAVVMNKKVDLDTVDLLTKRIDNKREYSTKSINTLKKLIEHSNLPITQSSKYTLATTGKTSNKVPVPQYHYYKSPDELLDRAQILAGEVEAGNITARNEIIAIFNELYRSNSIDNKTYNKLVKKYM